MASFLPPSLYSRFHYFKRIPSITATHRPPLFSCRPLLDCLAAYAPRRLLNRTSPSGALSQIPFTASHFFQGTSTLLNNVKCLPSPSLAYRGRSNPIQRSHHHSTGVRERLFIVAGTVTRCVSYCSLLHLPNSLQHIPCKHRPILSCVHFGEIPQSDHLLTLPTT